MSVPPLLSVNKKHLGVIQYLLRSTGTKSSLTLIAHSDCAGDGWVCFVSPGGEFLAASTDASLASHTDVDLPYRTGKRWRKIEGKENKSAIFQEGRLMLAANSKACLVQLVWVWHHDLTYAEQLGPQTHSRPNYLAVLQPWELRESASRKYY